MIKDHLIDRQRLMTAADQHNQMHVTIDKWRQFNTSKIVSEDCPLRKKQLLWGELWLGRDGQVSSFNCILICSGSKDNETKLDVSC